MKFYFHLALFLHVTVSLLLLVASLAATLVAIFHPVAGAEPSVIRYHEIASNLAMFFVIVATLWIGFGSLALWWWHET